MWISAQALTAAEPEPIDVVLVPRERTTLSSEIDTRVTSISFEFGETFGEDDILLKLDETQYRENLERAEANLRVAEAEYEAAEKLFQRKTEERRARAQHELAKKELQASENLRRQKSLSLLDLEKARQQVVVAAADLERAQISAIPRMENARRTRAIAEAEVRRAQRELESSSIRAPYPGRVIRLLVRNHEYIQRGTPLIEIVDDSVLRARFLVPSRKISELRIGESIGIALVEIPKTVDARISHIAAALDPASQTVEVHAEIPNPEHHYRGGMTGTLRLPQRAAGGQTDDE